MSDREFTPEEGAKRRRRRFWIWGANGVGVLLLYLFAYPVAFGLLVKVLGLEVEIDEPLGMTMYPVLWLYFKVPWYEAYIDWLEGFL